MFLRVQGTRRLYFQWECARKWSHDLLLLRMHLWFCLKAKKDKVSKIKHFKYHSVCHFCAFPAISEPFSCSHGYPILWNYIFIAIKYLCRILALKAISVLQWVANVFNHWIRETQRRTPQWELLLWAAVIFKFSGVVYITLFLGRFQWVMMLLNASAVFSSCQKKNSAYFGFAQFTNCLVTLYYMKCCYCYCHCPKSHSVFSSKRLWDRTAEHCSFPLLSVLENWEPIREVSFSLV